MNNGAESLRVTSALRLVSEDLGVTAVAVSGALMALCACLAILALGHLDEDAYILFTYSTHLAQGHGIVWDLSHGHAEGATDFLWMVLLAGCQFLGLDVGAGAALLNSLGWLLGYYAIAIAAQVRGIVLHGLLALTLLLSHLMAASLGGFSTLFFCGVFAANCALALRRDYDRLAYALLVLALIRPDGVLLAAGVFAALITCDRSQLLKHGGHFALAGAAACGYFFWRWFYFGLPLPLPLMVKGHTLSVLAGLRWNVLPLLPLVGVLALIMWRRESLQRRQVLIVLAGPALLFVFLALANQMQNLAFRFQAPITISILMLGFLAGRERPRLLALALLPSLAFGARAIEREVLPLVANDYVNYFFQILNPSLGPETRLATTEAGRFGYRLDGSKLDIVGLDSTEIALGEDRAVALARFAPDLTFLHQVWTLDTSSLDASRNWLELTRQQYLTLPVHDSPDYSYHTDPTHMAAMAARRFIATTASPYYLYAVRYRGEFSHLYFLRAGGRLAKSAFESALQRSFAPNAVRPHCAYSDGFPCRWLASRAGV